MSVIAKNPMRYDVNLFLHQIAWGSFSSRFMIKENLWRF